MNRRDFIASAAAIVCTEGLTVLPADGCGCEQLPEPTTYTVVFCEPLPMCDQVAGCFVGCEFDLEVLP